MRVLPDDDEDPMRILPEGHVRSGRFARGTNIEKGYNLVKIESEVRLVEHAVYTLANPVRAHLVARSKRCKGVFSLKMQYGMEFFPRNDACRDPSSAWSSRLASVADTNGIMLRNPWIAP